jgi:hypothetical protein
VNCQTPFVPSVFVAPGYGAGLTATERKKAGAGLLTTMDHWPLGLDAVLVLRARGVQADMDVEISPLTTM